jgi:DNA primase
LDGRRPKYLSEQQRGYIFNIDAQQHDSPPGWQVCVLVEGQFDAISIGGCAYMGSNISDEQAMLLKTLQRRIIVVPDQDSSGMQICDSAMNLGYQVSIPDWSSDIKDVNDAVKKYGKFPTLLSILQNATSSKITVEMKRKKFK